MAIKLLVDGNAQVTGGQVIGGDSTTLGAVSAAEFVAGLDGLTINGAADNLDGIAEATITAAGVTSNVIVGATITTTAATAGQGTHLPDPALDESLTLASATQNDLVTVGTYLVPTGLYSTGDVLNADAGSSTHPVYTVVGITDNDPAANRFELDVPLLADGTQFDIITTEITTTLTLDADGVTISADLTSDTITTNQICETLNAEIFPLPFTAGSLSITHADGMSLQLNTNFDLSDVGRIRFRFHTPPNVIFVAEVESAGDFPGNIFVQTVELSREIYRESDGVPITTALGAFGRQIFPGSIAYSTKAVQMKNSLDVEHVITSAQIVAEDVRVGDIVVEECISLLDDAELTNLVVETSVQTCNDTTIELISEGSDITAGALVGTETNVYTFTTAPSVGDIVSPDGVITTLPRTVLEADDVAQITDVLDNGDGTFNVVLTKGLSATGTWNVFNTETTATVNITDENDNIDNLIYRIDGSLEVTGGFSFNSRISFLEATYKTSGAGSSTFLVCGSLNILEDGSRVANDDGNQYFKLPLDPEVGCFIEISNVNQLPNLVIQRSDYTGGGTSPIQGIQERLDIDATFIKFKLTYTGTTYGWVIT